RLLKKVLPVQKKLPSADRNIWVRNPQQGFQKGCFSAAAGSGQARTAPRLQGKTHMVQKELSLACSGGQILDFHHACSPPSNCFASRLKASVQRKMNRIGRNSREGC